MKKYGKMMRQLCVVGITGDENIIHVDLVSSR